MLKGSKRAEFVDVEVLKANEVIVSCRVSGKVVGIPTRRMMPGTTLVPQAGAWGRLVISRELALNLGLLLPWP
jgi:hypothetical protein